MGSCPLSHTALGRSCDKLKPYLYHSLYGHQTGEDSDLLWGVSKSHDALIIWSCKITGQSKTIIFRLPHSFWPPNLGGLWLTLSGSHPENYTTLWSHGLERLRDKLKLLNRHYHSVSGQEAWQVRDLLWRATIHIVTWPLNHVVLLDHVTN